VRIARLPASKAVFVNCPLEDGFEPIFRAMIIHDPSRIEVGAAVHSNDGLLVAIV
jgi:hypothetical protein